MNTPPFKATINLTQGTQQRYVAAGIAILFSALVFLPALGYRGSLSGQMFIGDAVNLWLPQLNALRFFIHNGVFSGIDLMTHNGASEFFLRPNLVVYHPVYLLVAFGSNALDPMLDGAILLGILALHAFLSVYYTQRLCQRYLGMGVPLAAFVAVGYTFSWHFTMLMNYVPFAYVVWLMPMIIYYCIACAVKLTFRKIALGTFAAFCSITSGYLPLTLGSFVLVGAMVVFWLVDNRNQWPDFRSWSLGGVKAMLPVGLAILVTLPFIFALWVYSKNVIEPSYANNVNYSAFDLALSPQTLLRAISGALTVPGPNIEFSLHVGLIAICIFVLYISLQVGDGARKEGNQKLLAFCLAVWVFLVLIIFGRSTALSALFYYFTPIIGFSHIYQRYLPLGHLFLMIACAIMLKGILARSRGISVSWLLAAFGTVTIGLCLLSVDQMQLSNVSFTQELIVECFYACILLLCLLFFGGQSVIWVATLAMFLVAVDKNYEYTTNTNINARSQKLNHLPLNRDQATHFDLELEKYRGEKLILKVADITPGIHGYIPENYPWFRIPKTVVSWYSGYEVHVGVPLSYRAVNRTAIPAGSAEWRFLPSAQWLAATGADVLIFDPRDKFVDKDVLNLIDTSRPELIREDVLGRYKVAPLKQSVSTGAADNGFFRVVGAPATITNFSTNYAGSFDFTIKANSAVQLKYLFWPNRSLVFSVNGKNAIPTLDVDGLASINIVEGTSILKVRYINAGIIAFQYTYAAMVLIIIVGFGLGILCIIAPRVCGFTLSQRRVGS